MSSPYTITITNETIWNFYKEHPNLDFENINLIFIEIISKMLHDVNNSFNSNLMLQLIEHIKSLQTQVNSLNESLSKDFTYRLADFKREYIDDLKVILTNNVSEKIAPLIKEQNSISLDKTQLILNDLMIKSKDNDISNIIHDAMKDVEKLITNETNNLLSGTITKQAFNDFINNIDNKLNYSLQTSHSLITSTEQRLETSIKDIKFSTENQLNYLKDISTSSHQVNSALNNNVSDILKKMEISSNKGKISESILFNILHSLYPCSQIDHVGNQKETGDIILTRNNKPTILIENKNWDKNVIQEEVRKFIHDVETQDCCGLFLSQNYGIANKENFEININNGNVLLYVHEVNNDPEKIKLAINIIDHFKSKLDEFANEDDIDTISKELLEEINKEYQNICCQKLNMIKLIKDCNNKMLKQMEEFQLPSLDNYLSSRFAFSSSKFVCDYCQYIAKNQQAISAHQRGCSAKKEFLSKKDITKLNENETGIIINMIENKKLSKENVEVLKEKKKTSKK